MCSSDLCSRHRNTVDKKLLSLEKDQKNYEQELGLIESMRALKAQNLSKEFLEKEKELKLNNFTVISIWEQDFIQARRT